MELFCVLYLRTTLDMSEAFDHVMLFLTLLFSKLTSPSPDSFNLSVYSPIHSTRIHGASTVSGPSWSSRVWTRHRLQPLTRDLLFPKSSASPYVDTMEILWELILCNLKDLLLPYLPPYIAPRFTTLICSNAIQSPLNLLRKK